MKKVGCMISVIMLIMFVGAAALVGYNYWRAHQYIDSVYDQSEEIVNDSMDQANDVMNGTEQEVNDILNGIEDEFE